MVFSRIPLALLALQNAPQPWKITPKNDKKAKKTVHSSIGAHHDSRKAKPSSYEALQSHLESMVESDVSIGALHDSLKTKPPSYAASQCPSYVALPSHLDAWPTIKELVPESTNAKVTQEYMPEEIRPVNESPPPSVIPMDSHVPSDRLREESLHPPKDSSPPPEMQSNHSKGHLKRIRGLVSPWMLGGDPLHHSTPRIPPPCAFCHSSNHGYLACGRYYLLFHGKRHAIFRSLSPSDPSSRDIIDSLPLTLGRPSSLPEFVSRDHWLAKRAFPR